MYRHTETHRDTHRHGNTHTYEHTDTHRDTATPTETHRHRQRHGQGHAETRTRTHAHKRGHTDTQPGVLFGVRCSPPRCSLPRLRVAAPRARPRCSPAGGVPALWARGWGPAAVPGLGGGAGAGLSREPGGSGTAAPRPASPPPAPELPRAENPMLVPSVPSSGCSGGCGCLGVRPSVRPQPAAPSQPPRSSLIRCLLYSKYIHAGRPGPRGRTDGTDTIENKIKKKKEQSE